MKVFISWSLPRSEALATFMRQWLGDLIQPLHPWVSTEDLRKGTAWYPGIGDQLREMAAAIVCVTPENIHEDWLLFEAGAAAGPGHPLFTYLVDLEPEDIDGPLAHFNHTSGDHDDTLKMVVDINKALEKEGLDPVVLKRQFERMWGDLEKVLEEVCGMEADLPKAPKRETDDMIAEILNLVRQDSRDRAVEGGIAKILSAASASVLPSVDQLKQAFPRDSTLSREIWGKLLARQEPLRIVQKETPDHPDEEE